MTATTASQAVTCQVGCATLARAVTNAMLFVSDSDMRPGLERVHVQIVPYERMVLEATDGAAMLRQRIDIAPVYPGDTRQHEPVVFDVHRSGLCRIGQGATLMMSESLPEVLSTVQLSFAHGLLVASFGLDGPTIEVSVPVCDDDTKWPSAGGPEAANKLWPKTTVPCKSFYLGQPQLERILALAAAESKGLHPPKSIRFATSDPAGLAQIVVTISDDVQVLQMPVRA